jgi:hypothetical protein
MEDMLVVLRQRAEAAPKPLPSPQPTAVQPGAGRPAATADRRSLLPVFALSALFSVAAVMWLHILADARTSPAPTVQSESIQAQTAPPEVEIARPFETVTAAEDPAEPTQAAAAEPEAAERTRQIAIPEPALSKFRAWAAQRSADVPTENAEPPRAAPATDAQAKASAAEERAREQEALADKRWEERHARRLAAARKPVRSAPQPQQAQQAQAQQKPRQPQQAQAQQQKPQQAQKPAPTASVAPPVVPEESDSMRGGG